MRLKLPWDVAQRSVKLPLPSKEEFLRGKKRRFGSTNPEWMRLPFWDHMVLTEREPYWLREIYGHEKESDDCPIDREQTAIWSFRRIGMTTTTYGDQFRISIGGEHDDWYDPDFLIYNDVIVRDGTGKVWVYGYSREVFPPTDFHTATLLDEGDDGRLGIPDHLSGSILVIGGLGYPEDRQFGRTPVFRLSLSDLSIEPLEYTGEAPGWIHHHTASLLSGARILVEGGEVLAEDGAFVPNQNEFLLDLQYLHWTKRTIVE